MFELAFQSLAFSSFPDFLQMGKHGFYVWLCYGLTLLTFASNIFLYHWKKKKMIQAIRANQVRKQKQAQNFN